MSSSNFIVGLDIGTSCVRAVVADCSKREVQVIGIGSAHSRGMKKGAIIDIDQAVTSIREAIESAERMIGIEIHEVFVGISGGHVTLTPSHGVVAVSNDDREIGVNDIERVLQAARVISLPPERTVVEVVPKQFVVDGLREIKDPNGMIGVRLEVEAMIVTGAKTMIHNVLRCVEKASLTVAGVTLLPLAESEICLSSDEKNLGSVLIDLGGGTTTLTVFQQGELVATAVVPVGGENITNDLAIGLRTQREAAEKIKVTSGIASTKLADDETTCDIPCIGSNQKRMVSQMELAQIIEPRVEELFLLVQRKLEELGYGQLAGGWILTGGGVSLRGTVEVAERVGGVNVRTAISDAIGDQDPSYSGGIGVVYYIARKCNHHRESHEGVTAARKQRSGPSPFERVKSWFSEFI
ncbi:cell division protein FtsA [Mechercharimyces sp. CAU 1602]|uniref:cell division protein FtsA n=1 Tax=Mechercharimyces sp. CAU 1602 TaxID=2973933 RepID=UPI0021611922|nr:cell division protein FtsA [Mechercharimyces sp. CAU 1602]MCS1350628.1 cell division protein FtsA [Mechercharimyces sp. CAU 1602]